MNNKEQFDLYTAKGILKQKPEERIKILVDELIMFLYEPDYKLISIVDNIRLEKYKIDGNEPINWGDLKCCDVTPYDETYFIVTVDEAEPNCCPSLCNYIEKYMKYWGWDIRVYTEW